MPLDSIPIVLHHTLTDTNSPSLLYAGEPAIGVGPSHTKMWIGDGNVNRLFLSTDPADAPLLRGFPEAPTDGFIYARRGSTSTWQGLTRINNVTVLGENAAARLTTGSNNTAVGQGSLGSTTGSNNTAIGNNAMAVAVGAHSTVAVGSGALARVSSGLHNTAIGFGAAGLVTTGSDNIAIGSNSLAALTTGSGSIAIGRNALETATAMAGNIAIGGGALRSVTTAPGNVALGNRALEASTGGDNVAVGFLALAANTTAGRNTAVGRAALESLNAATTAGEENTALGHFAGRDFGPSPGTADFVRTTSYSVFLGANSRPLANNQTNQIVIGHNTVGRGSNTAVIGNANVTQLWLGNQRIFSFPEAPADGQIYARWGAGPAWLNLTSAGNNVSLGHGVFQVLWGGTNNTGIGHHALHAISTGSGNVAVGVSAGAGWYPPGSGAVALFTPENSVFIGNNAFPSGDGQINEIVIGHSAIGRGSNTAVIGNNNITGVYSPNLVRIDGEVVAVGPNALSATTGGWNVAFGDSALASNTTGTGNIAVGTWGPLWSNTTGDFNIAIGGQALFLNSSGSANVAIGFDALTAGNGTNCVAIGRQAARYFGGGATSFFDVTSANDSVFIGVRSGPANNNQTNQIVIGHNTVGRGSNTAVIGNAEVAGFYCSSFISVTPDNTAFGRGALAANVNGVGNIAIGEDALRNSTSNWGGHIAFGEWALRASTGGGGSIAIGNHTLRSHPGPWGSIAIGGNALVSSTSGSNTAIGGDALFSVVSGENNVAIGGSSMRLNQGSNNVGVGDFALANKVNGNDNIAIGRFAGTSFGAGGPNDRVATANESIFIGVNARASANDQTNEIVIGTNALGRGSGTITLGNNSIHGLFCPNVLTASWANNRLGWRALESNVSGERNTAIGAQAMRLATGSDNIAVGNSALTAWTFHPLPSHTGDRNVAVGNEVFLQSYGNDNVAVGHRAGAASFNIGIDRVDGCVFIGAHTESNQNTNLVNQIVIGRGARGVSNNSITLGDTSITALRCQVTTITALSDPRLKENIARADLDRCLDAVKSLPVHRYRWRDIAGAHADKHVTGWLPDDVAKVFPKAVTAADAYFPKPDADSEMEVIEDCKSLTMTEALPTLWGAVQRLIEKNDELERRVEQLTQH